MNKSKRTFNSATVVLCAVLACLNVSASYVPDPEIGWTVTVTNSSNTAKPFTREPVYLVHVDASADDSWVIPDTDESLEQNLATITRGKSKEMAPRYLPESPREKNGGDRVEVYLLRRSLGSQTNTMFRTLRTLANQLQVLTAVDGIDDPGVGIAIDDALRAIQDDDDTLGGFVLKLRRLSAGQIRATWSPIGESNLLGSPQTQYVADRYRPYVRSRTRFLVGQSIYPYIIEVSLIVRSCCQTIGIEDFVAITAPLPTGGPSPVPPNQPAQPAPPQQSFTVFPCSKPGLGRSNLCVEQPYPVKRGTTAYVVWRIESFKYGEFDRGDGAGFKGPIYGQARIDVPNMTGPRTVRLRWTDLAGQWQTDEFTIEVVD